jgi:hypothetical protein
MDAFADRGQQDHRGDADGDAEQGQEAAQAVRGDRAQARLQGVGGGSSANAQRQGLHRIEPRRAPRRQHAEQDAGAQRRAKSASTAQSGGKAGNTGKSWRMDAAPNWPRP